VAELAATVPAWTPVGPWAGLIAPGRFGREPGTPGLVVRESTGALAAVIAKAGQGEALAARLAPGRGAALPTTPRVVRGADLDLIWSGPGQWLARGQAPDLAARLARDLGDLAAVSDQGASRAVLHLSGPRVRDVLAKGCMVDLHPQAFRPGDVALTTIAHIGVQIWQLDEAPSYEVAVSRSYAGSFWSWLMASAAEFGCEVVAG
jgi:sarcosine oxidase subunit gamma